MFTGLIEDVGRVAAVGVSDQGSGRPSGQPSGRAAPGSRRLTIETRLAEPPMAVGESLAVDGVCLTVVASSAGSVALVAAAETLARTTIGSLSVGREVNLERPLRLGDRLGGHLVAGHVDGVGKVAARGARGEAVDVTVTAAPEILRYIVEKGSIAIDGISMTVNRVDDRGFAVSLIPHTQSATTLARKRVGDGVNLEVDLIGKYVEKLVAPHAAGITIDTLRENGFA